MMKPFLLLLLLSIKNNTFHEKIITINITYGKISSTGKGTYTINNFSLVFTYNDGRKIQVSFTGIKNTNPATNSQGYMINGLLNYKLG